MDAPAIGVTRQHLFEVLRGRRISEPCVSRYLDLLESQGRPIPAAATALRKISKATKA